MKTSALVISRRCCSTVLCPLLKVLLHCAVSSLEGVAPPCCVLSCFRDSLFVAIGNCLTSVFAGFVIFSIIGFIAREMGVGVDEVAKGGRQHSLNYYIVTIGLSINQSINQSVSIVTNAYFICRYSVINAYKVSQHIYFRRSLHSSIHCCNGYQDIVTCLHSSIHCCNGYQDIVTCLHSCIQCNAYQDIVTCLLHSSMQCCNAYQDIVTCLLHSSIKCCNIYKDIVTCLFHYSLQSYNILSLYASAS